MPIKFIYFPDLHYSYSLYLSKWDCNLKYTIKIKIYRLKFQSEMERLVVELIEQQIWDELKPAFGKRSGLM